MIYNDLLKNTSHVVWKLSFVIFITANALKEMKSGEIDVNLIRDFCFLSYNSQIGLKLKY